MQYRFLIFSFLFLSCNWGKQKAKEAVNKTGEIVAKTGSEFADGVSKGIEKTFQNQVVLSDALKSKGLRTGRILIAGSDSARDNIISAYLIFDQDFDQKITIKVFSPEEQEYGRVSEIIKGQKGEARYVDFTFDKRTNIDGKGKLSFE